jgi:alpha-ketoglutarate-dependent taurine dioxygenase
VTDELQKEFNQRLGELGGKPKTSGLHIHPIANSSREHGTQDDEISVISSKEREKLYEHRNERAQSARSEWHSDITFEPIPSDYTSLRLVTLPKTGGGKLASSER